MPAHSGRDRGAAGARELFDFVEARPSVFLAFESLDLLRFGFRRLSSAICDVPHLTSPVKGGPKNKKPTLPVLWHVGFGTCD